MAIQKLAEEIINGKRLGRREDLSFFKTSPLKDLCQGADNIRQALCGDTINLCSIINGKGGRCSEDCKFCSQSSHFHTDAREHSMLNRQEMLKDCKIHAEKKVHRYSIVTAGRNLNKTELEDVCLAYGQMRDECHIDLCASHGLLSKEALLVLKESGVSMYHQNIETSKRNFPNICSTHSYEDKIKVIKQAQEIGLGVCSGGIIGMGETFQDRLDMAISLAELKVESIPINILIPIKGTPFEGLEPLKEDEILRTIAIFRFINPTASIRLAAGRSLMQNSGKEAFRAGANATITGDLLTTSGNNINEDKEMIAQMGLHMS